MGKRWSPKRTLLYSLIGALVLCALLGIYAFVFGQFGETEIKILVTTLGVSFYSLTAMGCFAALEKRRSTLLALSGLGVCAAGMLVLLGVIWLDGYEDEATIKLAAVLGMFAFSFAQVALLSLAPLEPRLAWVKWVANATICWLAIQLSVMLVWEIDDEWLIRAAGVLGIVDGCASLVIPILCKVRGGKQPAARKPAFSRIELTCPRCGRRGTFPLGPIECAGCSLRLRVEVSAENAPAEDPPFQFSIKSLLLITLIVAVALSVFTTRLQRLHVQRQLATALREAGAYVRWRHGDVVAVTFHNRTPLRDEDLALLERLPRLESLTLQDVPAGDRQIGLLKGLDVRRLDLSGTRMTDAGLEHLEGMAGLGTLNLGGTQVSARGVERLRRALPRCRIVYP